MEFLNQKNIGGNIALMSVIIILLMLLALVAVLSTSGYFSRFNVLAAEYKKISLGGLAGTPAIMLRFWKPPKTRTWTETKQLPVGVNECNIKSITYNPASGNEAKKKKVATIKTWAQYPLIKAVSAILKFRLGCRFKLFLRLPN